MPVGTEERTLGPPPPDFLRRARELPRLDDLDEAASTPPERHSSARQITSTTATTALLLDIMLA